MDDNRRVSLVTLDDLIQAAHEVAPRAPVKEMKRHEQLQGQLAVRHEGSSSDNNTIKIDDR